MCLDTLTAAADPDNAALIFEICRAVQAGSVAQVTRNRTLIVDGLGIFQRKPGGAHVGGVLRLRRRRWSATRSLPG